MAKICIAGKAVVVTSAMKLEDLKTIAKYRPGALVLKGGEDGKEPIFAVKATNGNGRINQYGAEFGDETNDENKLATMTLLFEADGDVKEVVADTVGAYVVNLNKLEATLPGVLEEIKAERSSILESITVAQ